MSHLTLVCDTSAVDQASYPSGVRWPNTGVGRIGI